ncbi:hypothetical protein TI04_10955 [Achromatium sp. WMS2]|nr:hypothetical protein TI04_10955 [Achromatium sp. WMS2]
MWVLGYDQRQQSLVLEFLGLNFLDNYSSIIFIIILTFIFSTIVAFLYSRKQSVPIDIPTQLYLIMCKRLARVGILRLGNEGPTTFANKVARRRPDLAPIVKVMTNFYIRLHYAKRHKKDDLANFRRLIVAFHPKKSASTK